MRKEPKEKKKKAMILFMIVSVSLGVLTCWFPLHLKAVFFPLISADYLTHYDKKRTKYMDACYFMDILRK